MGEVERCQTRQHPIKILIAGPILGRYMSLLLKSWVCYFLSNFDLKHAIRSQICTCHGSWAVVVCAKLWHDNIIVFRVSVIELLTSFGLWAPAPFVQWAPDIRTSIATVEFIGKESSVLLSISISIESNYDLRRRIGCVRLSFGKKTKMFF